MIRAHFLELTVFTSINAGRLLLLCYTQHLPSFLIPFSVFKKAERILGTLISCVCVKCVITDSCKFSVESLIEILYTNKNQFT